MFMGLLRQESESVEPRFLDSIDYQSHNIDKTAVQERNHGHLETSVYDTGPGLRILPEIVEHLEDTHHSPDEPGHEPESAEVAHPGRSFPGSEEYRDKNQGNHAHAAKASLKKITDNVFHDSKF